MAIKIGSLFAVSSLALMLVGAGQGHAIGVRRGLLPIKKPVKADVASVPCVHFRGHWQGQCVTAGNPDVNDEYLDIQQSGCSEITMIYSGEFSETFIVGASQREGRTLGGDVDYETIISPLW